MNKTSLFTQVAVLQEIYFMVAFLTSILSEVYAVPTNSDQHSNIQDFHKHSTDETGITTPLSLL